MSRRVKLAERIVAVLVPGCHVVQPAYEPVKPVVGPILTGYQDERLICGSGPEHANESANANPNWLYWRAANLLAIADEIRKRESKP